MLIPDAAVLNGVDHYFMNHHCWHEQRYPKANWLTHDPAIFSEGQPGAGSQFLAFHHELLQQFQWIIAQRSPRYAAPTWPDGLPTFLTKLWAAPHPEYMPAVLGGIRQRVEDGDMDGLGTFIEIRNPKLVGSGIHDNAHRYLGALEGDAARGFTMAKMSEACRNELFWSLHTWIDRHFVQAALKAGKTLPDGPLSPDQALLMPKTCPEGSMSNH